MRKVEVSSYTERWASMFEEEADKLRNIFGEQLVTIYHIGSTSVPELFRDYLRTHPEVVQEYGLTNTE